MTSSLTAVEDWTTAVIKKAEPMGQLRKRGDVWWIRYYRNGRRFEESARTDKKEVARDRCGRDGEAARRASKFIHRETRWLCHLEGGGLESRAAGASVVWNNGTNKS